MNTVMTQLTSGNVQTEPLSGTVNCPYILPTLPEYKHDNFKLTTKVKMINGDIIELENDQYELIKPLIMQNSIHKYDFAVKVLSESCIDFDHLYVSDELISGRINWNNVNPSKEIEIKYFTPKDLNIPWWKFWINKAVIVNEKNKALWQEAVAVAHVKRLPPVPPPTRHKYG